VACRRARRRAGRRASGGQGFHSGRGGGSHGGFHGHSGGRSFGQRHHGFHHHGFHGRAFIGAAPFFWWAPGYVHTPPAVVVAPPVYAQPESNGYWYYCPSAQAYYPDVAACPEPWVPVPAR